LEASTIPVSNDIERIKVTKDVTDRIGQKRTMRSVRASLENNLFEIKQILNWRKISIDMMNNNSSRVQVRKLESIDIKESRTVESTREDGKIDSDMW
jgi:hypothetical protein